MLTVAISKRNKLQNIIVLTPKDGLSQYLLMLLVTEIHTFLSYLHPFSIQIPYCGISLSELTTLNFLIPIIHYFS